METVSAPALAEVTRSLATVPAADEPDLAGTIGRYLVLEEIGRGGMGIVLRAYDPKLRREVALKRVHGNCAEGGGDAALRAEDRARMLREAHAMAKLSHPNVVAVYDVEASPQDIVLAMEFVRGTTLKAWLAAPRPWREVVAMFRAAGAGLAAAHRAGLLHRDFKPANVLVGDDGRARVTDFGLARVHAQPVTANEVVQWRGEGAGGGQDLTQAGVILGTPRYMAPEQYVGGELGPATDQYAFCVALWEALNRTPPFASSELRASAEHKRRGPPAWPRESTVPPRVRDVVNRGLAPLPSDRFASMDALLDQLDHLLRITRSRSRSWAIMGGLVALASASAVATAQHRQQLAQRCTGAADVLAKVWNDERRESLRTAIISTGVPYAADVWQRLEPQLSGFATAWAAMHTEACRATSVHGEQSPEVLDLRMACLDRAAVDLRAVTDLLSHADAQVVANAHEVVGLLPELSVCADVAALRSDVPPPSPMHADAVDGIRTELADARALREAGKYPEFLAVMQALAPRARAVPHPPLEVEVQVELGIAQAYAADYAVAEATFRTALRSALSRKLWREAVTAAVQLVQTAGLQQMRPHEGLAYAATAQGLLALGGSAAQADLHTHVGLAFYTLGRFAEAEAQHRRAIAIVHGSSRQSDLATFRGNLGLTLLQQGRLEDAISQLRERLSLRKQMLGDDHPETAHAHYDLGQTVQAHGHFTEAEEHLSLALRGWEKSLGPEHLHVGVARHAVALALSSQGRDAQAEAQLRESVRIQRKSVGNDHGLVSATLRSLGNVLIALKRLPEAEDTLREALAISIKVYGHRHVEVGQTRLILSMLLLRQDRYAEAEVAAREAKSALVSADGTEGPLMYSAYECSSAALKEQGRFQEAEVEARTGLAKARAVLGPDHPVVAQVRSSLGAVLEEQGRLEEAQAEQRAAIAATEKILPPTHRSLTFFRIRLAATLRKQQRHEEAEALYRETLTAMRQADEPYPLHAAELVAGLGHTLVDLGRRAEARSLLEPLVATWESEPRLSPATRAWLVFALARSLHDHNRASALARRARALYVGSGASRRAERAALGAWLSRAASGARRP